MCGIAGVVHREDRSVDRALLKAMADTLIHRGPDGEGYYAAGRAGLAHRRLSIIDIEGGQQPISNEDGTVWVVFNGEIYNFQEIRLRLEKRGHRFATKTDTEVLVHLYEDHGADLVDHLRGMFSFALWDSRNGGKLLLARDRVGKKPLYYVEQPQGIAFGSEIKALLQWEHCPRNVDPIAVYDYLTYGYVPSPNTILQEVKEVPPAHVLVFEDGDTRLHRYWRLDYRDKLQLGSREEYLEAIRAEVLEATRARLISDVPIGAFLSGGIDSGSVVACMAQASDQVPRTFTIGFEDDRYCEADVAREVAEHLGTSHRETIVEAASLRDLPDLVWHFDQPFADMSAIPTFHVATATRRHATVALSGDGGDEGFAGYPRYRQGKATWHWPSLPRPLLSLGIGLAAQGQKWAPSSQYSGKARRFLEALREYPDPQRRHARWIGVFHTPAEKAWVCRDEFLEHIGQRDSTKLLARIFDDVLADDPLDQILAVDMETYLAQDLLVKMDRTSMAASLEVRSPYLDHHLLEFAARIPASLKLSGTTTKPLLRDAWHGSLPASVTSAAKRGFRPPVDEWFKGSHRGPIEAVLTERPNDYLDPDGIRRLLEAHATGRDNHIFRISALLSLELWIRRVLRDEPIGTFE